MHKLDGNLTFIERGKKQTFISKNVNLVWQQAMKGYHTFTLVIKPGQRWLVSLQKHYSNFIFLGSITNFPSATGSYNQSQIITT